MRKSFIILLCCISFFEITAQNYYVSTLGSDNNNGAEKTPWLTLTKALNSVGNGATINIGAGTFTETNYLIVPTGVSLIGAGSGLTTILVNKYYNLEQNLVYCDGSRAGWAPAIDKFCMQIMNGGSQTIKGFSMNGQSRTCHGAIYVDYANKVIFDDLNIQNFKFTGLWIYKSDDSEIRNCYFKDNCYGNANNDAGNIMFHANNNLLIHDNVILETGVMNGKGGYGIKTYSKLWVNSCFWTTWDANWNAWAIGTKIYNNTITVPELGTWLAGANSVPDITIEFNGLSAKNCEIFNNTLNNHISLIGIKGTGYDFQSFNVHHNFLNLGSRYSYACEVDAQGMVFHHNYVYGGYYPLAQWGNNKTVNNLQVHHNVFDSPLGSNPVIHSENSVFKDFKFYNNTVIDKNNVRNIFNTASGSFTNVDIRNNLFIALTARADIFSNTTMTGKIDFNGFQNISAKGTNFISGDMKLTLTGNKPTPYALLQNLSPAIDAGVEIADITVGSVNNPDLGAYEYNGELWTCGVGNDTKVPTIPLNLTAKNISANNFSLSWETSTDNVTVVNYEVFKDGDLVGSSSSNNLFISGLTPLTSYSMQVRAIDAAGNQSQLSTALIVKTLENNNTNKLIIQAEDYNAMTGLINKTTAIGSCDNNDYAIYNNYDFTPGYTTLTVRAAVAPGFDGQTAEFRVDNTTGTLIASCIISNSGSWTTFIDNITTVQPVTGIHNLYVVFKSTFQGIGDFDYFSFSNPTKTALKELVKDTFLKIYLNPLVSGSFKINLSNMVENGTINIIDLQGVIVHKLVGKPFEIVEFSDFAPGIYIVQVISKNLSCTQKLIVK